MTLPILLNYNPLSGFWFGLTVLVETIAGLSAYFGAVYFLPWIQAKTKIMQLPGSQNVDEFFDSRLAKFVFKKVLGLKKIGAIPEHPIACLVYYIGIFGTAWIVLAFVTGDLISSVGWVDPRSWQGLEYDLIFARANGNPNGAHIVSYLGVVTIAWTVAVKFRQGLIIELFLGLMTGALLVSYHEGPYTLAYYLWYGQFLDWSALTNVLKDCSSLFEYAMFFFAFTKYPTQKMNVRIFKLPMIIYCGYLAVWFVVPAFLGYGALPITIVNNYKLGHTIYAETQWWGNPWVSGNEVFSWVFLFAMMEIQVLRQK